jgi:hypothetical protein
VKTGGLLTSVTRQRVVGTLYAAGRCPRHQSAVISIRNTSNKMRSKIHNYFWPGADELSDGAIDFGDLPSSLVGKFSISASAFPLKLVIVLVRIY